MNNKKKILFFHFDLKGGGAEKVLVNLVNHLNPEKYDITVQTIFGVGPNLKYLSKHIHFKCIFKKQFRGFNTIMKLLTPRMLHKLLIRDKYDIEIGYMENSPTRIVSGCPNPNIKTAAWVHIEIENLNSFLLGYRNKKEALSCYKNIDRICFVSQTAKDSFEKFLPEVLTPKSVIYNINDYKNIYELSKENIQIELDSKVLNICSVGRLTTQKRFDRLINIIYRIKEDGFHVHLYILGEGEERRKLEEQIKNLSLEENVTLLGYDVNPYKYVARMNLFVCSSQKEGYSTAVTEAVALGVPVLTTDCSGMREILNDGKYGIIVENDEDALFHGLKEILIHPQILDKFLLAQNQSIFDINKHLQAYEDLLDSM
ncbi:MAG: glycosyltransferase [Muribaculaceae bacterium]|nr:glycosyltransferase [Muribaculaceae bacterium]